MNNYTPKLNHEKIALDHDSDDSSTELEFKNKNNWDNNFDENPLNKIHCNTL